MSELNLTVLPDPRAPDPSFVKRMERLLELAKSGELQSFHGAGTFRNGDVLTSSGPSENIWCDVGALELLKARILEDHVD